MATANTMALAAQARRRYTEVLVGGLAYGRAALELAGAVRDLLGGQRQVVRAGLHGDPYPFRPGLGDQRQGVGGGQVEHVHARVEAPRLCDQGRAFARQPVHAQIEAANLRRFTQQA